MSQQRQEVILRLLELAAIHPILRESKGLVEMVAVQLMDRQAELLDVMLHAPSSIQDVACECLVRQELRPSTLDRIQTSVLSHDMEAVYWLLNLMRRHRQIGAVPKFVVDRGLRHGPACRRAAIALIPKVDESEEFLENWLDELFEGSDEVNTVAVVSSSMAMAPDFRSSILRRGAESHSMIVVSESLYALWYSGERYDWITSTIRNVIDKWPSEHSILLPALKCIKDFCLQGHEAVLESLLTCEQPLIAMEAAEAAVAACPIEAKKWMTDGSKVLPASALDALKSWFRDSAE